MISNADYRLPAIEQSEQSEQPNNLQLVLKSWPLIALLTIGLCFLTQLVAGWFGVDLKEQTTIEQMRQMGIYTWRVLTQEGFGAVLKHEASYKFLLNIPLVLVLAPVFEEILFRGLLFNLPAVRFSNLRVPLAILASALFSSAHYLQFPFPDDAFLALFFFGLAQCWLYRKTSHLWCAMLNHALFNLTNLVLLFVLPQ